MAPGENIRLAGVVMPAIVSLAETARLDSEKINIEDSYSKAHIRQVHNTLNQFCIYFGLNQRWKELLFGGLSRILGWQEGMR